MPTIISLQFFTIQITATLHVTHFNYTGLASSSDGGCGFLFLVGGAISLRCILTTSDKGDCLCLGLAGAEGFVAALFCLLGAILLVEDGRGLRVLCVCGNELDS